MIADYGKNIYLYKEFENIADMIMDFVKRAEEDSLEEGRYDLEN